MFFITISNGLLTAEHRKRIGPAVWEFMWLIDKITRVDEHGKGWVLGGKPIKLDDIGLGQHNNTTSENLQRLRDNGYIETIRTPYGMSIKVIKAKKRFTKNSDSLISGGDPRFSGGDPQKTVDTKKTIQGHNKDNIYTEHVWLNKTAWEEWIKHRKELRKPMTTLSVKKQITFLSEHKKDHIAIINQAIEKGWQGLYPLKQATMNSGVSDKAKAFDKLTKAAEEEQERKDNEKHNDQLREINLGVANIGKVPWNN